VAASVIAQNNQRNGAMRQRQAQHSSLQQNNDRDELMDS
jgi:hypothetical protein